ncbi:radical SAM/SPASM domain protein, ACGX system [Faecalicoccus pleomorphus]|uniref:radical SAM/SPASM domain protein, ACGX system n=1 Tax=Faecalicoccus pleomorphus TaxID=1323 RepID=UPI0039F57104
MKKVIDELPKFSLQWHITDRCDQRCKHCYIYSRGDESLCTEMDFRDLKTIFYDFKATCKKLKRSPSIVLTGGDPLLYPRIWELLEVFKENNIHFIILGNPFHLTDSVANRLYSLGCTCYQMSLDGLRKIHDSIRMPGSYDETLSKISIINASGMKSSIMTTVSKLNIDDIPALVEVVHNYRVNSFGFNRYCPSLGDANSLPTAKEYKKFLDKMWREFEKYSDSDTHFILKDHLWKLFLYEKNLFNTNYKENIILDGCHCGITHMTVLPDGKVYACRRSDTLVGYVPQQSLYDIFLGKEMDEYRKYDYFEKCTKCELLRFCRGCPSVAKCVNGSFYSSDPQCWKDI